MSTAIVWFRFDLRLEDNNALSYALENFEQIIPVFILDSSNNNAWQYGGAQKWWLHQSLTALSQSLSNKLVLRHGNCLEELNSLIDQHDVNGVFWNRHYEPYTIKRDQAIKKQLLARDIDCQSFSGYLLTEPSKIRNKQGGPFKVFTPFWRHCRSFLDPQPVLSAPKKMKLVSDISSDDLKTWDLLPKKDWAGQFTHYWQPGETGALDKLERFLADGINRYHGGRDFPAEPNTSKLSPHLHFGEISPKQVWHAVQEIALTGSINQKCIDTFLSQLGWREFSYHLLYQFPELPQKNFRSQFDAFQWHNNDEHLKAWQRGQTGYPIVDAGMRELWSTGTMHNRVRMIVGSFLIKDLFIDWREGESWFWDTLLDADLANNSASWQWVAGSGADAAPYFRIFNPVLQGKKFDPNGEYVRQWVPELANVDKKHIHNPWEASTPPKGYPKPIVDHGEARKKALAYYQDLKQE